jgi:hypothetical protein
MAMVCLPLGNTQKKILTAKVRKESLTKRKIDRIHRIENRINRIFFGKTP